MLGEKKKKKKTTEKLLGLVQIIFLVNGPSRVSAEI